MKLIRKQVYITAEQDRAVKQLARKYDVTEAEILRRALDTWLEQEDSRPVADPLASLIGMVNVPEEVDHDDIYRRVTQQTSPAVTFADPRADRRPVGWIAPSINRRRSCTLGLTVSMAVSRVESSRWMLPCAGKLVNIKG